MNWNASVCVIKKTLKASEQNRADIVLQRKKWKRDQSALPFEHLFFVDESNAKTNMRRLYGRAVGGKRCKGFAPNDHWKSMTMLSSIKYDGTTQCMVVDGATDRYVFETYIKKVLCPALKAGDIVVMDNLAAHKTGNIKSYLEEKGAKVLYLPPYSPDLNPIENMWSKIKQFLKGIEEGPWECLERAIGWAFELVSAKDASGWFKHCGYR